MRKESDLSFDLHGKTADEPAVLGVALNECLFRSCETVPGILDFLFTTRRVQLSPQAVVQLRKSYAVMQNR